MAYIVRVWVLQVLGRSPLVASFDARGWLASAPFSSTLSSSWLSSLKVAAGPVSVFRRLQEGNVLSNLP